VENACLVVPGFGANYMGALLSVLLYNPYTRYHPVSMLYNCPNIGLNDVKEAQILVSPRYARREPYEIKKREKKRVRKESFNWRRAKEK
jgi:hypothetical protein